MSPLLLRTWRNNLRLNRLPRPRRRFLELQNRQISSVSVHLPSLWSPVNTVLLKSVISNGPNIAYFGVSAFNDKLHILRWPV